MDQQPVDYAVFLQKLLARDAEPTVARTSLPILSIDECANHPAVRMAAGQAVKAGRVDRVVDLWYQLRQRQDGTHVQLAGKFRRDAVPPEFDIGNPVKGHSWPDSNVALLLTAQFGASNRVILVSENTKRDVNGLRRILAEQVAPSLLNGDYNELGLLAFMKRGKTTWEAYADHLLSRICRASVKPGYEYVEV